VEFDFIDSFFAVPAIITRPKNKHTEIKTTVGGEIMLLCQADGYPKPEITWSHNETVILTNYAVRFFF
jgi:hypothetical protein